MKNLSSQFVAQGNAHSLSTMLERLQSYITRLTDRLTLLRLYRMELRICRSISRYVDRHETIANVAVYLMVAVLTLQMLVAALDRL